MEIEQKYYTELDNLKHENEMEILAVRAELDETVDRYKQKEREAEIKFEELNTEIRLKQKQIDKLNAELKDLKMHTGTLKEEIDMKQREIKQMKVETVNEIRNKEAIMQQKWEDELSRLSGENHKQKQMLVVEFKQAQDLLKQKIVESENEYVYNIKQIKLRTK